MNPEEVRGDTVLLVAEVEVEVADTSLRVDDDVKAPLYAHFGVREYWVINARSLITTIYREPTSAGYGLKRDVSGDELSTTMLAPSLAVRLGDLDHE